jgi:hypothetical protein
LLEDLQVKCLLSVTNQTLPIQKIVILSQKSNKPSIAERVSEVLNEGLSRIDLTHFDYILRIDGDTVIPSNFLEENLKIDADLCGRAGYAQVIKVSTFLKVMSGKFNPFSDDSYLSYSFWAKGYKVFNYALPPILSNVHLKRKRSWREETIRGIQAYILGYEPIHAVYNSIKQDAIKLRPFYLIGYLMGLLTKPKKCWFASKVWSYQVNRLLRL